MPTTDEPFWTTEPRHDLLHRRGTFEYGLYPGRNVIGFGLTRDGKFGKKTGQLLYTREIVDEMVLWAAQNCKQRFTYSEKYGSFYFECKEDRLLFMMFHPEEHMAAPLPRQNEPYRI